MAKNCRILCFLDIYCAGLTSGGRALHLKLSHASGAIVPSINLKSKNIFVIYWAQVRSSWRLS